MKILLVNKFLYPKGGSETYVLKLGKTLQIHGHEVQYFGLANDKNTVGNEAGAYVSNMDFNESILRNLNAPLRIIYSAEARKQIRKVLDNFHPDIVHLNNIHYHLTPSIILEVEKYRKETKRKVKIIYTAHDFQLVCPSHGLFDSNMRPCEKCLDGNYLHCFKGRCIKNSRAKSLLGTADAFFWKWKNAYSYVDKIICCSEFLKSKLDSQERFSGKTIALHNFVDLVLNEETPKDDYILQFGHLSKDKGTLTLLKVAKRMPETRFVFAGFGSAVPEILLLPNAEYVGFKTGPELEQLIRNAAISVCPSEIYENCPFSVIESQAYGTPVVGSRMGGIPELISVGETGEIFEAGNADELELAINRILDSAETLRLYSKNCKLKTFETPESYYKKLLAIYMEETG